MQVNVFKHSDLRRFLKVAPDRFMRTRSIGFEKTGTGFTLKKGNKIEVFDYPFHIDALYEVMGKLEGIRR